MNLADALRQTFAQAGTQAAQQPVFEAGSVRILSIGGTKSETRPVQIKSQRSFA